jgi:hypothetical protein
MYYVWKRNKRQRIDGEENRRQDDARMISTDAWGKYIR